MIHQHLDKLKDIRTQYNFLSYRAGAAEYAFKRTAFQVTQDTEDQQPQSKRRRVGPQDGEPGKYTFLFYQ